MYDRAVIEGWESYFVAQAGAAAALAGLVFVALSINLEKILELPGLPGRAAEAIILMVLPVFTALVALVPYQSQRRLGIEFVIVSLFALALLASILRAALDIHPRRPLKEFIARPLASVAVLVVLIGGVVLISGSGTGLDWQLAGALACLLVGITDAWVLLVEILR